MHHHVRLLLVVLAFCGCHIVPDQPYRTRTEADLHTPPASLVCLQESQTAQERQEQWAVEPLRDGNAEFGLTVLEFRDNAAAWSQDRYDYVMRQVRTLALTDEGALIVVFAHGWKNNAEECNGNVSCFRRALAYLARIEQDKAKRTKRPPRNVVGVYLGWRGQRIDGPLSFIPKQLTFWSVKNTALGVGSGFCKNWKQGHCAHADGARAALDELANIYDEMRQKHPASRMVIVGHSFGAQVVYAALHDRLAESLRRDEIVKALGNLVILVNPAFEAAQYDDIERLARERAFTPSEQQPVLLTISTSNDWATHFLFPLGQLLSPTPRWRSLKWLATIGNYPPFHTHTLTTEPHVAGLSLEMKESCGSPDGKPRKCDCDTDLRSLTLSLPFKMLLGGVKTTARALTTSATCEDAAFGGALLSHRKKCVSGSPLLNVSTDKTILNGHSGIFNRPFTNFLISYVVTHDPALVE